MSGSDVLKAAVVGAGVFGTFHARKYAEANGVELMAIVDPDPAQAGKLAEELGVDAVSDLSVIAGQLDLVTVACPAVFHYQVAKQALSAGAHVLVEKPIALKTEHADELIQLAKANGLTLQVGHQERFVFDAFGLLSRDVAPTKISATRAGPFTGRAMDVSVVMDLMIHDLDLIHQVIPGALTRVDADAKTIHGDHPDEVTARLSFGEDAEVVLHASRIAEERDRNMSITYPDGVINIDFINRKVENTTSAKLGDLFGDDQPAVMADPLGFAVSKFIDSVRTKTRPVITGQCGRRALDTALKIHDAAEPSGAAA